MNVYGIEMNEVQNMNFSKWLNKNNIAMNTRTADQRKEIASNWLRSQSIEDGFGGEWSIVCSVCDNATMQVVRPGKVQCSNCG